MDKTFNNYYICIIDIMGQKSFFDSIRSPNVSDEVSANIKRVSDGLREMVEYVVNRYTRIFKEEDDVGVELFSDSIILSLKANDNSQIRFATWLEIIIKVIFIACRYQLPFRGSLVKGVAQRSTSGKIYGDGVVEAMKLEQTMADSFRIILSNTLAYELDSDEKFDDEKYLEYDIDSEVVLNYAGPKILSMIEFEKEKHQIKNIYDWVSGQFEYYCYRGVENHDNHANPKLARRFKIWQNYLKLEVLKTYS